VSERRGYERAFALITSGLVIGAVEVVLAISFASLVFGGYLYQNLADGIGLYLVAGALTLAIIAWRAGSRGAVGSIQDAAAPVLALIAFRTALDTNGGTDRSFLTVVAATLVVTVLTGITFLVIGGFRLGNLIRLVPYPVVGGFLAGTGWLLVKGGIQVATSIEPTVKSFHFLTGGFEMLRWVPAVVFGVVMLWMTRVVKRPLVIPTVILGGLVLFAIAMLVTGSSIQDARDGLWLLGPFNSSRLWHAWSFHSLSVADWSAVIHQTAGIVTAVFIALIACMLNVSGLELILHTDLDLNQELRDAGVVNLVSGGVGGIPAYHAVSLTSLAQRSAVGARAAGLVAAIVPLAIVVFGASVIELVPRLIVGGVLCFVGLAFIVAWLVDARKSLPLGEYAIVLAILGVIVWKGYLPGVVVGLVLAFALFAVKYSRIELVRDVEFGSTYRSNVDRPSSERLALRAMADRVQILRVNGFVFFGTARGLIDRVRKRAEAGSLRFLMVDLRRVTGMDSSAVMSFLKVAQLAETKEFELVFSGVPDMVRKQLGRGGVVPSDGVVRFEPDLDHGLQWCEDGLLKGERQAVASEASGDGIGSLPARLVPYLERRTVPEGTVLIRQGDPSDDLFVLESGRLRVEHTTPEGTRMRLNSVSSGVVVGEIAMYLGTPRTSDVVAETASVVLRLNRASIRRMETAEPELAAALHRWLAETLAERVSDASRVFDALLD
jgi:sulfate permease, SulP family